MNAEEQSSPSSFIPRKSTLRSPPEEKIILPSFLEKITPKAHHTIDPDLVLQSQHQATNSSTDPRPHWLPELLIPRNNSHSELSLSLPATFSSVDFENHRNLAILAVYSLRAPVFSCLPRSGSVYLEEQSVKYLAETRIPLIPALTPTDQSLLLISLVLCFLACRSSGRPVTECTRLQQARLERRQS
jgi:hypothetical protein